MPCDYNQWDKGGSKDLFHRFLRTGLRLKNPGWHAFKPGKENIRRKINISSYKLRRTALLKGARNNSCRLTTGNKKLLCSVLYSLTDRMTFLDEAGWPLVWDVTVQMSVFKKGNIKMGAKQKTAIPKWKHSSKFQDKEKSWGWMNSADSSRLPPTVIFLTPQHI